MKVLIVGINCSTRMGGEAILPYHYFRLLAERGIDVHLITHARNRHEMAELLPSLAERISYTEDAWFSRFAWKAGRLLPPRIAELTLYSLAYLLENVQMSRLARKLVRTLAIDVVHQPTPVSPKQPSHLSGVGAPVIFGPMNGGMEYPAGFSKAVGWAERLSLRLSKVAADASNRVIRGKRNARLLLYANERTQRAFPKVLAAVPKRLLVENGVDLAMWRRTEPDDPESVDVRFLFVGRLIDWKGTDYLLKAFARAVRRSDAHLTIAGQGPERSRLEALARELGIAERVTFLGFVRQDQVPALLRSARALILPSIYECGGAVVLEAMASGRAVIASAWGGPLDYVDEQCGILVTPRNEEQFVQDLSSAIVRLAEDQALARRMGEHGLDRAQRLFGWDTKIDQMIAIYADVLGSAVGRDGTPARQLRTEEAGLPGCDQLFAPLASGKQAIADRAGADRYGTH